MDSKVSPKYLCIMSVYLNKVSKSHSNMKKSDPDLEHPLYLSRKKEEIKKSK